jgi:hypothetical protein
MTSGELATQIEIFLLNREGWVAVAEICTHFRIPERMLRADGKRRPLLARFAISSTRAGQNGFKHLSKTTVAERLEYKHNRIKRLIAERRALDEYTSAFHSCLTGKPQHERFTQQGLLSL